VLIANRGEIACRIIRSARAMGVRTVAVYSDADAGALHVRQADEAIAIGPAPAAQSYLRGDRIVAAARRAGVEAVHPGYGFLSESPDFAQAVVDAGLVWIGPKPDSIRAMGLKDAAKAMMAEAGVPVTPGYHGENQDPAFLAAQADKVGYPVLIKATAGGGGKGMRKVDDPRQFADALVSCRREAQASFANERVLIEAWIDNPRHIEVQVFGDAHGNLVHLFERDCSLQRRHQKIIEEAPAPGMDAITRQVICDAALRAARAVGYVGAGTVEFIADTARGLSADRIWFMEMNTRLQVEHAVTEEITGIDMVEWQLRVAGGERLPLNQEGLAIRGHAIEARLYAEDPARDFLPSTGRLDVFALDPGTRTETSVEQGDVVSSFYDPLIAKIIVHGQDRDTAISKLKHGLNSSHVAPVRTNKAFLFECLDHSAFAAGRVGTAIVEGAAAALPASAEPNQAVIDTAARRYRSLFIDHLDSFVGPFGFRLNAPPAEQIGLYGAKGYVIGSTRGDGESNEPGTATTPGGEIIVTHRGETFVFGCRAPEIPSSGSSDDAVVSPMPGTIVSVAAAVGDHVTSGQLLLVLEAMKMEHALVAPFDGVVVEIRVVEGAQVAAETLLARVEREGGR
jgi:3-methylcrotonyl-CoA carboxylase alpha subunit